MKLGGKAAHLSTLHHRRRFGNRPLYGGVGQGARVTCSEFPGHRHPPNTSRGDRVPLRPVSAWNRKARLVLASELPPGQPTFNRPDGSAWSDIFVRSASQCSHRPWDVVREEHVPVLPFSFFFWWDNGLLSKKGGQSWTTPKRSL